VDIFSRFLPRRWWAKLLVGMLIFLVIATASALIERQRGGSHGREEVEAAVGEADRTDPDWRWDALNAKRTQPPEGRNGADLIRPIANAAPKEWGKRLLGPEWNAERDVPANIRYPQELIDEVKAECEAAKDAIAIARTMKDRPTGQRAIRLETDAISTKLPDTQDTRVVVNLLRWDVVLAVESADANRAGDSLGAMLATSRSLGSEPFLISQLVRIACRTITTRQLEWALAQGTLPEAKLQELQLAIADDAEEPLLLHGLRGERAAMDVLLANLLSGAVDPGAWREVGDVHQGVVGRVGWWWYRGWRLHGDRARMLASFNTFIERAKLPVEEQASDPAAFKDPEFDDEHRIYKLIFPSVQRVSQSWWRSVAETRCTVVGVACERFRMKHGRWPESTAALVPEFLPAVPLDPFDKRPLRFKRLDDGLVIYSVGQDRADDGGDLRRIERPEGKDEGFRLWDVKERRKSKE